MEIRTDRRVLRVDLRPETHARLARRQASWLRSEIRFATDFDEIHTSRHYRIEDCATATEYGQKLGFDSRQVRRWLNLGVVLRREPRAELRVRSGHLSLENAELLAPIYRKSKRLREGDDWIALAEKSTTGELRALVRQRVEEVASGEICRDRTIAAPDRVWDDFARARDVASTKAKHPLTEGETLGTVLDFYLDKNDRLRIARSRTARPSPLRVTPLGAQPAGSPTGLKAPRKQTRHIPVDTEDGVWIRSNGCCEFPGCRCRRGLQNAHILAYAAGGPHDLRNIVLLCAIHHALFDAGRLIFVGWTEDGLPIFETRLGGVRDPPQSSAM